ncbi:MAG: hypothetical protein K0U52_01045 [Gammaproteobacteria bacterium]|nr:hypothetical protein [Gammaproteobacteria bacterium]
MSSYASLVMDKTDVYNHVPVGYTFRDISFSLNNLPDNSVLFAIELMEQVERFSTCSIERIASTLNGISSTVTPILNDTAATLANTGTCPASPAVNPLTMGAFAAAAITVTAAVVAGYKTYSAKTEHATEEARPEAKTQRRGKKDKIEPEVIDISRDIIDKQAAGKVLLQEQEKALAIQTMRNAGFAAAVTRKLEASRRHTPIDTIDPKQYPLEPIAEGNEDEGVNETKALNSSPVASRSSSSPEAKQPVKNTVLDLNFLSNLAIAAGTIVVAAAIIALFAVTAPVSIPASAGCLFLDVAGAALIAGGLFAKQLAKPSEEEAPNDQCQGILL